MPTTTSNTAAVLQLQQAIDLSQRLVDALIAGDSQAADKLAKQRLSYLQQLPISTIITDADPDCLAILEQLQQTNNELIALSTQAQAALEKELMTVKQGHHASKAYRQVSTHQD
ncbi:MAG: hypothetical protein ACJAYG_001952 [Oceanicoccus sp.]|jgi:hypothetical protein